jgi:hypothetical protein
MKHLRRLLLVVIAAAALVSPGWGCSHEGSSAVFVRILGPDMPYTAYVHGRLGVVGPEYRVRHLVVAYNILSGRGLSPAEQKGALELDRFLNPGGYWTPESSQSDPQSASEENSGPGLSQWRSAVGGDSGINDGTEHPVPGQTYSVFDNCLDDAFAHAAVTLADLRARYSRPGAPDPPDIRNWIAGQRAVFANCQGKATPQPVPVSAPLWLRQERAYQMAAAQFYSMDYANAIIGFRAIAADKASPSAPLAHYLVARAILRQAEMSCTPSGLSRDQWAAQQAVVQKQFGQAHDELEAVLRDPSLATWHRPARQLLDRVMLRYDPGAQAEELATRLTSPAKSKQDASEYKHNVIDLAAAYRSLPLAAIPLVASTWKPEPIKPHAPFLRWIDDLSGTDNPEYDSAGLDMAYHNSRIDPDRRKDALDSWHSTHALQWLVAAMTLVSPGDAAVPELIEAAKAVPPTSPAYPSVTYHRLRLASAQTNYAEVSALLPEIERTQSRSTVNLFLDIQASLAPTLDAFLDSATRLPASYTDVDGFENGNPAPDYPLRANEKLCGVSVYDSKTPHFDAELATIFNQRMSLPVLRDAALSPALPPNLRFQLTHMAWTRALLLDDPATAHALTPTLETCQPALKPWLDRYDAATTPDDRHVLGLLAMMRFTSTEPTVRAGGERDFALYDDFRDNWWCSAGDDAENLYPGPTASKKTRVPSLFAQPLVSPATQPDPPFLTDADRAALQQEFAILQKVPTSSNYFAREALAWVKAHPDDPRNPDVLGFAIRVVRNACRSNATKELNHQLFNTLHRRYPKSEWAKRYSTWM